MLRMAAIRERLGETIGSNQLIDAAVRAVLAGVPGAALARLAALGRREEADAHDLFEEVVAELDLAPESLPAGPVTDRWELVYWWCRLIVEGGLLPEVGGDLIRWRGWSELGYPDALQPLVGWVSEWDDWSEDSTILRDACRQRIIEEAALLLAQRWPPNLHPSDRTVDEETAS